jgi:pimeloyl-ACP methyl ester carboxylesterase
VEPRLREVDCPVLLVAATDDPHSYPSLTRLRSLLPNAQIACIEGGTVPLPDGHPKQFAAAVERFLDTLSG